MKKKVLLITGVCILLLLGIFMFLRPTNDDYLTLPLVNGMDILVVSHEAKRTDGMWLYDEKRYNIPKEDTALFAEYSTLLNSLEFHRCKKDSFLPTHNYYFIMYDCGTPGTDTSFGVTLRFNKDVNDIFFVQVEQIHGDSDYAGDYTIENMEEWRKEFLKLLEKSEAYQSD